MSFEREPEGGHISSSMRTQSTSLVCDVALFLLVTHVRYYRQEAPRCAPRCATKAFLLFFLVVFLPAGSPSLRDTGGRSRL